MRRIYDSDALRRDDGDPGAPNEIRRETPLQAMRSVPSGAISDLVVPSGLGRRFISVDVETAEKEYALGESIPFTVTIRNHVPFPVSIATESPVLWTWSVDGDVEASAVPLRDPPDEPGRFEFDRGEYKRFRKRWNQLFRVTETDWEPAETGEYTIGAAINVPDPASTGLRAETTVRIVG